MAPRSSHFCGSAKDIHENTKGARLPACTVEPNESKSLFLLRGHLPLIRIEYGIYRLAPTLFEHKLYSIIQMLPLLNIFFFVFLKVMLVLVNQKF